MRVEIWSDLICPWCYIAKRRFEIALSRMQPRPEAKIIWRSFELDPNAPTNFSETLEEMLVRRYEVSAMEATEMNAHVARIAALDGLQYNLKKARPGNTFSAHRLIHYAATLGMAEKLMERLMRGYFTESLPIGQADALLSAAIEIGMDQNESHSVLSTDRFAVDVRSDEQRAMTLGISGVPFFLINEKNAISGAQPLDVFESVLSAQPVYNLAPPDTKRFTTLMPLYNY